MFTKQCDRVDPAAPADNLGAELAVHVERASHVAPHFLVRQEARAFESERPRVDRSRERVVRSGSAERCDPLRSALLRSL